MTKIKIIRIDTDAKLAQKLGATMISWTEAQWESHCSSL